ncbi:MAG: YceI family protein [Planctomycetota bacterium]|nr:YceI family protein [Planctomycetota bacterium]
MTTLKARGFALIAAMLTAAATAGCENPADNVAPATVNAPAAAPKDVAREVPKPAPKTGPTASAAAPAAAAGTSKALAYTPDSKVEFVGSKVTGKHEGGFKSFTGGVELADGKAEVAKVTADIDMASTYTDNEKLTGHLKAPDFFDVAKYPKATFVSTEIKTGGEKGATHTITGDFTLHGVTKSISFPAKVEVTGDAVKISSEFFIKRKDFGISYPGMTNDLIRDEVVIKLTLTSPRTKAVAKS